MKFTDSGKRYLNGNILRLVKNKIAEYEDIRGKEACDDDLDFCKAISIFFPEHYPVEKMGKVFFGLRSLLESEYEFIPELAMEYVMYTLIQERIELADGLGIETLEPISEQRDYVVEALRREYPDMQEISDDGADMIISWREKLKSLEDLHYYETTYFWDYDFMLLEGFSEGELLASPVSKFLGIENIGDRGNKFVVPPEWLK